MSISITQIRRLLFSSLIFHSCPDRDRRWTSRPETLAPTAFGDRSLSLPVTSQLREYCCSALSPLTRLLDSVQLLRSTKGRQYLAYLVLPLLLFPLI